MANLSSLLERFCAHWETLTGLRICIYDLGYFSMESDRLGLPYTRRTHCSGYCTLVKTSAEAQARCVKTETWRAQQAGRRTQAFVHRCHAGVTDLIVPIKLGTRVIGAIFVGQAAPKSPKTKTDCAGRVAGNYALPESALLEEIGKLPTRTSQDMKAFEDTAQFIADYIRQTLGMAVTESLSDAQVARDAHGRIVMEKVPNYFLDHLSVGPGLMKDALRSIRENYWRDIDQPRVAAQVGISESHFSRTFKRSTGMTFRRCLVEARLSAAAWLTKKTDLKIKEISDLLNYRDTSSLQRALLRHSGVTPTELRRRQPMPWHMNQPGLMPS